MWKAAPDAPESENRMAILLRILSPFEIYHLSSYICATN